MMALHFFEHIYPLQPISFKQLVQELKTTRQIIEHGQTILKSRSSAGQFLLSPAPVQWNGPV